MASVKIDTDDLLEMQRTIATFHGSKIVLARATNDSLAALKTKASQLIAAKITAKSAKIKSHFNVKKMIAAQKLNDLIAEIICTGTPLPLIDYSATKVKKGVSVRVLRANKKTVIKHAFIATMNSGHRGVFWRKFDDFRTKFDPTKAYGKLYKTDYSLPINELYGPPIPDIFDDNDIMKPTLAEANARLQARLEYHMKRFIEAAK